MRTIISFLALSAGLLGSACGSSTPPPTAPATTGASGTSETTVATKPERSKLVVHLKEHVKYPVSRADLLKACADTPEFSVGEKKWFETNLPDATYRSADDVVAAVKP